MLVKFEFNNLALTNTVLEDTQKVKFWYMGELRLILKKKAQHLKHVSSLNNLIRSCFN